MKPYTTPNKTYLALIVTLFIVILAPGSLLACDTEIDIFGEKKAYYQPGDEVILKVTIFLPHKNCPVDITDTKFKAEGLRVLGATKWKQVSNGLYERLVKIKIVDDKNKKSVLHVQRVCDKEGGYGLITLNIKS